VRGDLEEAVLEVASCGGPRSPEGQWAQALHLRYRGRDPEGIQREEARRCAGRLIGDLGFQFGRTIAGVV
jgi:hypothetical protein